MGIRQSFALGRTELKHRFLTVKRARSGHTDTQARALNLAVQEIITMAAKASPPTKRPSKSKRIHARRVKQNAAKTTVVPS